jgi:hypothetical protein
MWNSLHSVLHKKDKSNTFYYSEICSIHYSLYSYPHFFFLFPYNINYFVSRFCMFVVYVIDYPVSFSFLWNFEV